MPCEEVRQMMAQEQAQREQAGSRLASAFAMPIFEYFVSILKSPWKLVLGVAISKGLFYSGGICLTDPFAVFIRIGPSLQMCWNTPALTIHSYLISAGAEYARRLGRPRSRFQLKIKQNVQTVMYCEKGIKEMAQKLF